MNEDFAVESLAGDVFQLGNAAYRILRVERGIVRVEDAHGAPPTIPFWLGEAPGRSDELSAAVSRLRAEIAERLQARPERRASAALAGRRGRHRRAGRAAARRLPARGPCGARLPADAGHASCSSASSTRPAACSWSSTRPTAAASTAPGAWRCASASAASSTSSCRRRRPRTTSCCRSPRRTASSSSEVARYLHSASVRQVLIQALLDAPMFITRWRWVAGVSLALPRFRGGRKVPPQLARMDAEDLIGSVFPDQIACAENLAGEREIPDHPLVHQTIADCLNEAMDIEGLERLLAGIESGAIRVVARDLTEPSPLALEVLSARPYAFLDDAPLEERRTQAVMARRWLDPEDRRRPRPARSRGDRAGARRGLAGARPTPTSCTTRWSGSASSTRGRSAAGAGWSGWLAELARREAGGAPAPAGGRRCGSRPSACRCSGRCGRTPRLEPAIAAPASHAERDVDARGGADRDPARPARGPGAGDGARAGGAARAGARRRSRPRSVALEAEGFALRGRFTPAADEDEWCERRLLARIHRYTIKRLRAEIEPVAARDFLRFLFDWQHVADDARMEGPGCARRGGRPARGFRGAGGRLGDRDPAGAPRRLRAGLARRPLPRRTRGLGAARAPQRTRGRQRAPRRAGAHDADHAAGASRMPRSGPRSTPTADAVQPSPRAQQVVDFLRQHGASFFDEMVGGSGLLRSQVEEALAELVALGLVTSDSFGGLRALLVPSDRRQSPSGCAPPAPRRPFGMEDAGRWALVRRRRRRSPAAAGRRRGRRARGAHAAAPLRRRVLAPARARGRLAAAVARPAARLSPARSARRDPRRPVRRRLLRRAVRAARGDRRAARGRGASRPRDALVSLSGADPLNLVGILTPGPKLAALTGNRLLYRDGLPVALLAGGEVQFLETLEPATEWQARIALLRSAMPTELAHQVS